MSDKTTKQTLQELLDEVGGEKREQQKIEAKDSNWLTKREFYQTEAFNKALDTATTIIKRKIDEHD